MKNFSKTDTRNEDIYILAIWAFAIIMLIPIEFVSIRIFNDYIELSSCESMKDYGNYIRKQRYLYKWKNWIVLYPNIFYNIALKKFEEKKKEIIDAAMLELKECHTISDYDNFINRYGNYGDIDIYKLVEEAMSNRSELVSLQHRQFLEKW